ncbi:MAG TPA: hypothetical protein ENI96_09660 [Sedimenticola thiotaurini]|uniref:Uncharacterized protein n=1 Tax=Sedimenticola thiotaurini TaxID=1543721 RepID=A0A831W3J5_9GAMM|nr:hypothetical protein [Sedimenticola thiotaurini]
MIGPVDSNCAKALCRSHREVQLSATADELRIFYNLAMDRVHYFPRRNALYFVDSVYRSVPAIIRSVLSGTGTPPAVEQLYLDDKHYFKAGKRIKLPPRQANAVLVALRLEGIQVSISE